MFLSVLSYTSSSYPRAFSASFSMLMQYIKKPVLQLGITTKPSMLSLTLFKRYQSTSMDDYELKIYNILKEKFEPKNLEVRDISGGCGSMFSIDIESAGFKGLTMIKQHRLVNDLLKDEISKWHGLQLKTKVLKE